MRRLRRFRVPVPRVRILLRRAPAEQIDPERHMGLLDHLYELRNRLAKAFIALVVGTLIGLFIGEPVLKYLQSPYGREFTVLGPTGGVVAYFRVSLLIGAIVSIPVVTYQIMMFVIPGLTAKEKRVVLYSLPAIVGLFIVGVLFSWFILIPPALDFLATFASDIFRAEWTADQYLGFVTSLIFWMGVAFEIPLIFFVLGLIGLVGPKNLLNSWRFAVVGSSIAAALITPTVDPVNMMLVMGPLLALYAASILLVGVGNRIGVPPDVRARQASQPSA
jgi:sec-independent protein translocase protein TatC